jgi:hypothetical protein
MAVPYRLRESTWTVADPQADVRGRTVVYRDRDGEEVGGVDDLLVDDRDGRVCLLQVGAGVRGWWGAAFRGAGYQDPAFRC